MGGRKEGDKRERDGVKEDEQLVRIDNSRCQGGKEGGRGEGGKG